MKKILISRVAKLITKKLLAWLISKAPFMAWGPFSFLASWAIQHFAVKALELTFLGAMLLYINIDVSRDLNAVEKIIKDINDHEGDLTQEDMDVYDKKLAKAGRELIQFGTIG